MPSISKLSKIAIIFPCYNEAKRLKIEFIEEVYNKTNVNIFLVNDGSSDNTLEILQEISEKFSDRIKVIHLPANYGKANTIYYAIKKITDANLNYIGYFDADFSTPPNEIVRLINIAQNNDYSFVLGSRVGLFQAAIQRKMYRHYIGRIIVSIIDFKHHLGIYDTQCGAKLFSSDVLISVLDRPFKTSWLFDVELFIRLRNKNLLKNGIEIPLTEWKDIDGSNLSWKSFFKVLKELYIILKLH